MNRLIKFFILTSLLLPISPAQAKYLPAKILAGTAVFFAAMAPVEGLRMEYTRHRLVSLRKKSSDIFGDSPEMIQKKWYWIHKYEAFEKRAKIVEKALRKVHSCFGVNVDNIPNGLDQYIFRAAGAGLLSLAAAGIEYGLQNHTTS